MIIRPFPGQHNHRLPFLKYSTMKDETKYNWDFVCVRTGYENVSNSRTLRQRRDNLITNELRERDPEEWMRRISKYMLHQVYKLQYTQGSTPFMYRLHKDRGYVPVNTLIPGYGVDLIREELDNALRNCESYKQDSAKKLVKNTQLYPHECKLEGWDSF